VILREFLKSKINGACITDKRLKYLGSIGIDKNIIDEAGILPGEKVQVLNYNNGSRIETYIIEEEKGSKKVILYGPAARCGEVGDELCILSYCFVSEDSLGENTLRVIQLSGKNDLK